MGHGRFTYFLLKGLKEDADINNEQIPQLIGENKQNGIYI